MIAPSTPAEMFADVVKLHLSSEKEAAGVSSAKQPVTTARAVAAPRISATASACGRCATPWFAEDLAAWATRSLSAGWQQHRAPQQSIRQAQPGLMKPMVLELRLSQSGDLGFGPSVQLPNRDLHARNGSDARLRWSTSRWAGRRIYWACVDVIRLLGHHVIPTTVAFSHTLPCDRFLLPGAQLSALDRSARLLVRHPEACAVAIPVLISDPEQNPPLQITIQRRSAPWRAGVEGNKAIAHCLSLRLTQMWKACYFKSRIRTSCWCATRVSRQVCSFCGTLQRRLGALSRRIASRDP